MKTHANPASHIISTKRRLQTLLSHCLWSQSAIQPPTLLQQITGGSHVLRTSTGNQDCLVDSKPPQTLSALSLTLGVDQKTHAKIQSDEYVKFALLVKQNDPDNEETYCGFINNR